jgi:prepilin-type N-terminal cleavage/methylation domain-containing protein
MKKISQGLAHLPASKASGRMCLSPFSEASGRIYATKTGVTLLEMIVVMAIIVIITAASIPSFLQFINTSRLRGSARDITTALRTARRLAITTRISRAVTIYLWDYPDHESESIKNAVSFHETPDSIERQRAAANISFTDGAVPLVSTSKGYLRFRFSPRGTTASHQQESSRRRKWQS